MNTLDSLIYSLSETEKEDVLVVVSICEVIYFYDDKDSCCKPLHSYVSYIYISSFMLFCLLFMASFLFLDWWSEFCQQDYHWYSDEVNYIYFLKS